MSDSDLARFVEAQQGVYGTALAELRAGRKTSHWMWFVFPQMAGLGHSPMAMHYAIASRAEAQAYLHHRLLGERLRECARALLALPKRDPQAVLGPVDAQKLRSSMTLFEAVGAADDPFGAVLDAFYDGARDSRTLELIGTD